MNEICHENPTQVNLPGLGVNPNPSPKLLPPEEMGEKADAQDYVNQRQSLISNPRSRKRDDGRIECATICLECGKEYWVRHCFLLTQSFCSKTCRAGDPVSRFWSKVDKTSSEKGCWLWIGGTILVPGFTYGRFKAKGVEHRAHVYSWELVNGAVPEGQIICHSCDNPPCVNPAHLFCGTYKDNIQDCIQKGRFMVKPTFNGNRPRGDAVHISKLTARDVLYIRDHYKFGTKTNGSSSLARQFKVSKPTILAILHRKTWTHI